MAAPGNLQVRLKSRPDGIPQAEHFEIVDAPLPDIGDGQILIRNAFLSVEPAMRGFAADTVVTSRHAGFTEGDAVMGMFGWQHYAVSDASNVTRKIKETDLPLSLSLGVLGLNGVTAYFGLLDLGQPRPGDTVVVSTAAGAVGSAVGQIAALMGCRTVGITGGAVKTKLCREEFGYAAAIDYKASGNLADALAQACPRGVDVYFDNTAGAIAIRCWRSLPSARARSHLRHRFRFELGAAADGAARRAPRSRQARAHRRRLPA